MEPLTLSGMRRDVVWVALIVGVACLHRFGTDAVFIGLAIWALTSPLNAFRAVLIAVPLVYKNPHLGQNGMEVAVLRWVILLAAGWRIYLGLLRDGRSIYCVYPIRFLHLFGAVALGATLIVNPSGLPGFFKLAVFVFAATAILSGSMLVRPQARQLLSWLLSIGLVYFVGSALLSRTGIGYYDKLAAYAARTGAAGYEESVGDGGLMGLLSHSQSFGVYVSIVSIVLFITAVASVHRKLRWVLLGFSGSGVALMLMSQTRTAGVAFVGGAALSMAYLYLVPNRRVRMQRNFSLIQIVGLGLAVVLTYFGASAAAGRYPGDIVQAYIDKGRGEGLDLTEAYANSRGGLIELSLFNWRRSPLLGVGFGRNSWEAAGFAQDDDDKGIMRYFSNPNEKGVIWSAVLEETGVAGFGCFVLFVFSLLRWVHQRGNVLALGVLLVALLCNMGEMNFFSMGGLGLFQWACLGTALAAGEPWPTQAARGSDRPRVSVPQAVVEKRVSE